RSGVVFLVGALFVGSCVVAGGVLGARGGQRPQREIPPLPYKLVEWPRPPTTAGLAITKDQRLWTGGILRDLNGQLVGGLPGNPGNPGNHGMAVAGSGGVYLARAVVRPRIAGPLRP